MWETIHPPWMMSLTFWVIHSRRLLAANGYHPPLHPPQTQAASHPHQARRPAPLPLIPEATDQYVRTAILKDTEFTSVPTSSGRQLNNARNTLGKSKLCFNCLTPGHVASVCQNRGKCRSCRRCHHTLLHEEPSPANEAAHSNQTSAKPILEASKCISATALVDIRTECREGIF